jgi:N-sulfoglucosamine sulfohydrolase
MIRSTARYGFLRWLFVLVALSSGVLTTRLNAAEDRPNVLLILADNWKWPNAGVLGDSLAKTPTFDRIAREGVLFTHVFNPVPSCSPTRSCLLTGRYAHEIGERASLYSGFPKDTPVMTDLLRAAGYQTGYSGKPWGPGNHEVSGWKENPVGTKFASFEAFLKQTATSRPLFFWLGNTDTATKAGRLPYIGRDCATLSADLMPIPPELPDCPELRQDLLNYYGGIMTMDDEAGAAIRQLEDRGLHDKTIVIYASDNGWQMPRGLANCYDAGSRVPMAIRWGQQLKPGRDVDAFINNAELGPTILELTGIARPPEMTLPSFADLLLDQPASSVASPVDRDSVFIERERHADVRRDHLGYPMRAIRTRDFLYVRNLRSDRWPAGDPDILFLHGRPFGDVDTTSVKDVLLAHLDDPEFANFRRLIFEKRPAEELYDLKSDPHQIYNVAEQSVYAAKLSELRLRVDHWMQSTGDPRVDSESDVFDTYPYYGKAASRPAEK